MDKTRQGDIGVAAANLHYRIEGAIVSTPQTEQVKYDLVIDRGNGLERVQVKTASEKRDGKSYIVELRTNGGNHTTKNNRTKIDSKMVDVIFVLAMDGSCYEFSSDLLDNKSTVTLGPKAEINLVRRFGGITVFKVD